MVLKYGVCFIRLQSFRHFGAKTIKRWALKNTLHAKLTHAVLEFMQNVNYA